jgi:hypothetical protein
MGHAVAHFVEALRYKMESRGFDFFIGIFHWRYSSGSTLALWSAASNRNEYQDYFLGVKAAGA